MKRVSQPCDPDLDTRDDPASGTAPPRRPVMEFLKRLTLVCVFALSKRRVVLASTVATRLRSVLVVATPKMKAMARSPGTSFGALSGERNS